MKSITRVILIMLALLLIASGYNSAKTNAETETSNEYVKQLEEQVALLEGRIAVLELNNAVLREQNSLSEEHILLLEEHTQLQDSEIDRLWDFIRSTSDYQDLTRIIEAEASGEPFEGKTYVAAVVLNRVDNNFANSIHDVIYQPSQFSPVKDGRFARTVASEESIEAAEYIIKNGPTIDALYFMNPDHASEKSRDWMQSLTYVDTVGNHEFYR